METFYALLALCEGNPPVTGRFPSKRPVTQSFDIFFDLCLNKRPRKQSRRRWFEIPLRSLWHHCDVYPYLSGLFHWHWVNLRIAQYQWSNPERSGSIRDAKSKEPIIYTTEQNCVHVLLVYIDGLVQDCSSSSPLAMELQQSCTKPSIYSLCFLLCWHWWMLKPFDSCFA